MVRVSYRQQTLPCEQRALTVSTTHAYRLGNTRSILERNLKQERGVRLVTELVNSFPAFCRLVQWCWRLDHERIVEGIKTVAKRRLIVSFIFPKYYLYSHKLSYILRANVH